MIPILSALQTREADAHTIRHEPVSSTDLMERAAAKCFDFIVRRFGKDRPLMVFCGTGNNGGDGLVMARLLYQAGYTVKVFVLRQDNKTTSDFEINAQRLRALMQVNDLHTENDFPVPEKNEVVIDALLGTGLSRPPTGIMAALIRHINRYSAYTIAVDLPSGLYADQTSVPHKNDIINARLTLSFQLPRLAFFMPENAQHVGEFRVMNIGLDQSFIAACETRCSVIELSDLAHIIVPRTPFSHKGTYGHALLVAGSEGKTGAAVLSAQACLRAGAGLLTVQVPRCGRHAVQCLLPEAMLADEKGEQHLLSELPQGNFNALGMGPGLGTAADTVAVFRKVLQQWKGPMVLDADALNILSENKTWLAGLPKGCILTPHPKEFERLFGKTTHDFERLEMLVESAVKYGIYIVLKGRYTLLGTPGGHVYINTTGNPGMATGGSGDVLTGIITGLLAQGLSPLDACMAGVGLHGLAGDMSLETESEQSLLASDISKNLGKAFRELDKFRG